MNIFKRVANRISYELYKKDLRDKLKKGGNKTIKFIQETLESTSVDFFFDMGTLLGIIREGRLLSHDMDIDLALYAKNDEEKQKIRELFFKNGCTLKRSYGIDGFGIVEDSFYSNNIKFDINYLSTEDKNDVCYLMYDDPELVYNEGELSVVKLTSPHISEIKKINFNGIMINVPANAEEYLAVRYGENWRIPDKNYLYWKGPSTSPTDFVGKILK